MTKNRALEDKVAVLRRAGESAAATAAAAADEVELLRRQVIIAESQIKGQPGLICLIGSKQQQHQSHHPLHSVSSNS